MESTICGIIGPYFALQLFICNQIFAFKKYKNNFENFFAKYCNHTCKQQYFNNDLRCQMEIFLLIDRHFLQLMHSISCFAFGLHARISRVLHICALGARYNIRNVQFAQRIYQWIPIIIFYRNKILLIYIILYENTI